LLGNKLLDRASRAVAWFGAVGALYALLDHFHVDPKIELPLLGALTLDVFLLTELLLFPTVKLVEVKAAPKSQQPRAFVEALLDFARSLQKGGNTTTVLEIRDSMSHLLHLLGEHEARYQLGEIALAAAVQADDKVRHAEILIDDLGWAAFKAHQKQRAEGNINRGISLASAIGQLTPRDYGAAQLTAAKGYRHLAMMAAGSGSATKYLESSRRILEMLNANPTTAEMFRQSTDRDLAQVDHAEATIILRDLGLENSGELAAANAQATKKIQDGLAIVSQSATAFERLGDYERLTKALITKERTLAALGDETAALEIRAQRESLARSHSVRKQ